MRKHRLTIASLRLAAFAALGLCASSLRAHNMTSLAASQTAATTGTSAAVPTDSMSVELKAIFTLLEHSQKLNESAMALLREAVKAQQSSTQPSAVPSPGLSLSQPLTSGKGELTEIPLSEVASFLEAMNTPAPEAESAPLIITDTVVEEPVQSSEDSAGLPVETAVSSEEQVEELNPATLTPEEVSEIQKKDTEILRERNIGRFHRGLFNYRFIPKGEWAFGLTASYGEFNTDDMQMFDLISDVDLSGHTFSIKPQMQYFLRDNLSVGLRLNYTQTHGDIDSFKLEIDEDMNFNIHDVGYKGESYAAALTLTQYLGLSRRGRFGVFNEVELAFSSGNSDFRRPYGEEIRTTHTTTTGVSLTYSPGVSVFVMKNASFGVSFGVFGFSLKNEKQWVDGVSSGNRLTSGANFRFNIFNINFGISIHL